jgi:hypothetical protein
MQNMNIFMALNGLDFIMQLLNAKRLEKKYL